MKINSINVKNYKSLVDIKIDKPNPFTVFVGPNASGKSNILEAIEFFHTSLLTIYYENIKDIFGGGKDILSRVNDEKYVYF
ncbi:MAG: AAA family ATPase, partial [Bacteroidales bacterium]|nr:AAA family ATPase [Bacteroidales bacterium]